MASDHPPLAPAVELARGRRVRRTVGRSIGAIGFLATLVTVAFALGPPATFLHWPSALVVAGGSAGLLLLSFGPDGCRTALRLAILGCRRVEHRDAVLRGAPRTFFLLAAVYALGTGCLGFLLGTVGMLAALDDPAMIGRGLATALLSEIYGIVLAIAMVAVAHVVAPREDASPRDRAGSSALVSAGVVVTVASVAVTGGLVTLLASVIG